MNALETWQQAIASKSNDAALLFVLYLDSDRQRANVYRSLFHKPKEMHRLMATERSARAHCYLIKRAYTRQQHQLLNQYSKSLNSLISEYATHLLLIGQPSSTTLH